MNAVLHSKISVKKRGGRLEDYLPIHEFMDSTKELCSDNRHRILHTLWGVRRIVVPVFGHTILNSEGREVNVKDLCEQDHILPDYQNRFIPTLQDFVKALDPATGRQFDFEAFAERYAQDKALSELMLSPLAVTGQKNALLITHNSWFVNAILPRLFGRQPEIRDFGIAPSDLFDNMAFRLWMDNGRDVPESCRHTAARIVS